MTGAGDRTRRREPLSRARVIAAGVELADEVGLPDVSMRRLADRLGVVPMALYKHVADKEDLLDGLVDAVVAEFGDAGPGRAWKDGVRERLLSARRAVLRHPWARPAIESRTRRSPAVLGHMDSVAGALRGGGLSVDLTHHVMHALGNRIWGFSPELFAEAEGRGAPPASATPSSPDDQRAALEAFARRYPHVVEIAVSATGGRPGESRGCDEDFEFGFALDLLLDGAERLHLSGWCSAGAPDPV